MPVRIILPIRRSANRRPEFFHCPFHTQTGGRKTYWGRLFLFFYLVHEITSPAVEELLSVGALDFPSAERTRNGPARPAGVLAVVYSVQLLIGRHRAGAQLVFIVAARLPAALFMLSAIEFHRYPPAMMIM